MQAHDRKVILGARIRRLRAARGWSQSSLAARSGLGKATLSEIEAGTRNATLETLYAIAAQLEIGLSELLTEQHPTVRGAAVEATLIAAYRDPTVTTEVYRLTIHPGRSQRSPGHGAGVVEHLCITTGTVVVGPLGQTVELTAGDDWSFASSTPHSYEALGDRPAEAVLIIRHPVA
jgi:transcriptional regulator with XRE-family HTH domain